jgi:histidine triad (HIT) family protein
MAASADGIIAPMSACLFCRIASGDIPASKVFEDDRIVAFNDINPQAPMHVLIVPRVHLDSTNDLRSEHDELVGAMTRCAAAIAADRGYATSGYRTVINCQAGAGQSVFHLHMHVLGGRTFTWPPG